MGEQANTAEAHGPKPDPRPIDMLDTYRDPRLHHLAWFASGSLEYASENATLDAEHAEHAMEWVGLTEVAMHEQSKKISTLTARVHDLEAEVARLSGV
jgi:hypothetical protein